MSDNLDKVQCSLPLADLSEVTSCGFRGFPCYNLGIDMRSRFIRSPPGLEVPALRELVLRQPNCNIQSVRHLQYYKDHLRSKNCLALEVS